MTVTLVDMTHEDLPGVTKTTSLNAYRYGYFPVGWRSADDPEWEGAGTLAPNQHIGDNTLHGGGIELGYAQRTTNSSALAVTILSMVAVPDLVVTVPDLDRPVYLIGHVRLLASTASSTSRTLVAPVGSSSLTAGRGYFEASHRATDAEVAAIPFHRLPANSPGSWQVFVSAETSINVTCVATPEAPSSLRAVTA